jgi:hypothetical protein
MSITSRRTTLSICSPSGSARVLSIRLFGRLQEQQVKPETTVSLDSMAHINQQLVEERLNKFGKLHLIDDIIRRRAQDEEQVPILGYPRYEDSAAEYEFFTGKDLDRMVDAACRALIKDGFKIVSQFWTKT